MDELRLPRDGDLNDTIKRLTREGLIILSVVVDRDAGEWVFHVERRTEIREGV